jgi:hypothetical protein
VALAEQHPAFERLLTVPGFGPVVAAAFLAALDSWIFRPREATVPEHGKPAFRMMGSQWRRLVEVVTVV